MTSETELWWDAEDWTSHHSATVDQPVLPLLSLLRMKACHHLEVTKRTRNQWFICDRKKQYHMQNPHEQLIWIIIIHKKDMNF